MPRWGYQKYPGTNSLDFRVLLNHLTNLKVLLNHLKTTSKPLRFQWIHSLQLIRAVQDRHQAEPQSHVGGTKLGWAGLGREVQDEYLRTVGHCDIISDGLGFSSLALQSELLPQVHSSTMSVEQLKSTDPHVPWGDRLALVNIPIFLLRRWPTGTLLLLALLCEEDNGAQFPRDRPWGLSLCPD